MSKAFLALPNAGIVTVSYRGKGRLSSKKRAIGKPPGKVLERQRQQWYFHLVWS
jgi:hypothetical protein